MGRKRSAGDVPEFAAGNGLLDRRALLAAGATLGGAGVIAARPAFGAAGLSLEPWMTESGSPFTGYGQPSRFEAKVVRTFASAPGTTGTGASRTPLQRLNGTITPNGLHFERHHSGIPDIDPDAHRLLIHGLVKRPLIFTLEALARYPMETRIAFIECGGNAGALYQKEPAQLDLQASHGLLSCAEWTGVRLALLLDEAGVEPQAQWLLAEGADAAGMSRSVPMKAVDEALVALYQNGERVRPSNGYPLRLLLPGYEGNMNVKWLRRIKVTAGPTMTKDETSKYTILLPSGKSLQFVFPIEAKSVITHPSPGLTLKAPGLYEISGLAWSGHGKITRVEISLDGGTAWTDAEMPGPVLSKALTRFRLPWQWDGKPVVLQSRSTDEAGHVQPTRAKWKEPYSNAQFYQYNGIQSWQVGADNTVKNIYA